MSQLAFTALRLGFIVLLWVFVYLVIRVLKRDMADIPIGRPGRALPSAPRAQRGQGQAAPQAPPAPPRRNDARRLIITEGPLAGSTVPLSPSSIIIGRSPSSTLVLDDSYASSRHARVFPKDGSWWLEDLGSTNGTMLGGRSVHGAVELPIGVPVKIGQTTLELRP
ncbi:MULTISPECIES: FHA domain-containing protein FhaB/FipA [Actinomyces]|uniref:FHA domain-containing protein n=1 Tax=Actinomyces marmotae TaxID=2737173 RepID=A0A6M8AZP0_9ACTO|nr:MULTISPECIES: FHA domain-containing protein [Actinomyces]QKD78882.1 FHA domain-containing protein [Actinomyces marmotae]